MISWVTNGQKEQDILVTKYGNIRVATSPIRATCPIAINEDLGTREENEDDEGEILEDMSEDEADDYDSDGE